MAATHGTTPRAMRREATLRQIKNLARTQLAEQGATALSLRAIARELDMVSSNVYRYFASRDDLITALIVDAYSDLAAALEASPRDIRARAHAMRRWATAHPHLFALVYGSAIPGYAAPGETIEPASRVATAFAEPLLALEGGPKVSAAGARERGSDAGAGASGERERDSGAGTDAQFDGPLAEQAARMAAVTGLAPARAVALAVALATLVGHVTLELNGHFVGTFDPADALFDVVVDQVA